MPRKLLATLAIPLLLAACGDDDKGAEVLTGDAALAALQGAPAAVEEAGSGHLSLTIDASFEGQDMVIDATGAFTGDRYQMEIDFASLMEQLGEDAPAGFDDPITMVMEGESLYMRMPFLDQMLGEEGLWVGGTLEEMGMATGSLGLGSASANPTQIVELLRGSAGEVEDLGTDEIRDVRVHGYGVEVDIEKALADMPKEARDALEAQLGPVTGSMPVEVWLDGDGLPRRVNVDMSEIMESVAAGAGASVVMEFFDYGDDVEIAIPDPAKVRSFTELMGGLGGSQEFEETGEAIG